MYTAGLIYAFSNFPRRRVNLLFFILLGTALFVMEGAFLASYYLQNAGFNEAFFYHLRPDLLHSGLGEFTLPIVLLVIAFLLYISTSCFQIHRSLNRNGRYGYGCLALFLSGILISPPAGSLFEHMQSARLNGSSLAYDEFPELTGSVNASFKGADRYNLVLIYLESIEQRYFDEAVFPGLLPELKRIKDESLVFSRVAQGVGAGWTMGGFVASQCGYPLAGGHNIKGNSFGIYDSFMPGAVCLGDLLTTDGYHLAYMGGADERFAGKGNFLRSHGYSEVIDRQEILDTLGDAIPLNSWGIYDDILLDLAFEKFISLSSQQQPFMLTLLTLDTHPPRGHLSPTCSEIKTTDNPMLDSVHCADKLVSRFIHRIRSSPFSDNTIVAVFSDHLAMRNTASSLLEESTAPPKLTFFVNVPNGPIGENSHPGIHYDVAPTILDLLGYELKGQLGFGSSLVKAPGYLIRKFGEKRWREKAPALNAVAAALWDDDVSLEGMDFKVDMEDLSITIGNRIFDISSEGLPGSIASTIFLFDSTTLKLKDIHSFPFDQGMDNTTLSSILLQHADDLVFAISHAMNLPGFCDFERVHPLQLCGFFGKPGSTRNLWGVLDDSFSIPADTIASIKKAETEFRVVEQRESFLQSLTAPRGISPPAYVAHAGGGIENQTYTNSVEALNLNYDLGFRYFEIDFSWTKDGELVAIHDWEESLKRRFHLPKYQGVLTKNEFLQLTPRNGLTQLTISQVLDWAREKGDAYIITDIKDENVKALEKLIRERREFIGYVIPQVYSYAEYEKAEALGYDDIILTLYRMELDPYQLVSFSSKKKPFAITMHWRLAQMGMAKMIKPWNIFVYAHTVNDPHLFTELQELGVNGIYTDFLVPE